MYFFTLKIPKNVQSIFNSAFYNAVALRVAKLHFL